MWSFENAASSATRGKRAVRLMDAYLALTGQNTIRWSEVLQPSGLSDVRASAFLRPYNPRLARIEALRLRRLRQSIRTAALRGEIFHLWWHPHNFGVYQEENLKFLRNILEEFQACRTRHGMQSLTMREVHRIVTQRQDAEQLVAMAVQS
jgi:hypothetical protein